MSKEKRTIIGGLDRFRSARGNAGVDNAQNSLNSAFEQQDQAHQGLDQIEEEISQAQKVVKEARKAEKAEKRAAMVEILDGAITIPTRIISAVAGVCNNHPKKTILPALAFAVGTQVIDTDKLPSMPSVSLPTASSFSTECTNNNAGLRSQLGGFNDLSNAQNALESAQERAPTGTFKLVCGQGNQPTYLVQTNMYCSSVKKGVSENCTPLPTGNLAYNNQ